MAGQWKKIDRKPAEKMGVLLYAPGDAEADTLPGQDYRIVVAWFDGEDFREQGTGHEIEVEATHWMPLPPEPGAVVSIRSMDFGQLIAAAERDRDERA